MVIISASDRDSSVGTDSSRELNLSLKIGFTWRLSPTGRPGSAVGDSTSIIAVTSRALVSSTPTKPLRLDSNSGIVSHGHTHRLGAWRLQNPVTGGLIVHILYEVPLIYLCRMVSMRERKGRATVSTSGHILDHTACARLICLWPGHCRDSRGAFTLTCLDLHLQQCELYSGFTLYILTRLGENPVPDTARTWIGGTKENKKAKGQNIVSASVAR